MKKYKDKIMLGSLLISMSVFFYAINYLIFKDAHHIFMFLTEDIAFIPIEVLFVTLIIDRVLEKREKEKLIEKLNMVIGLFFSEIGRELLENCVYADDNVSKIRGDFINDNEWDDEFFRKLKKKAEEYKHTINLKKINLKDLEYLLKSKRDFLMQLLANTALLEHETFTELLQAVVHLQEELTYRKNFTSLIEEDDDHIKMDIKRVYILLCCEWVVYMKYLKNNYPYLFSTALINNPYDNRKNEEIEKIVRKNN